MVYETLLVEEKSNSLVVTLHRPEAQNSFNATLIEELNAVFSYAEEKANLRLFILQGENGIFCKGMDFKEIATGKNVEADGYMEILRRFNNTGKIVICKVDGEVAGGGVGLVAAADLVIATERSRFSLPEALWGLVPFNVLPFLIRKVGYQKAYEMTLTTQTVSAEDADRISLVDVLTEKPDDVIRRLMLRLVRLEEDTVLEIKQYFRKMWIITDEMERLAMDELKRVGNKPQVKDNITNFVEHGRFPWDRS